MLKSAKISAGLLLLVLFLISALRVSAENITPEQFSVEKLFDKMERQTDKIDAMSALVELKNSGGSKKVTLAVKNPNMFFIKFEDNSVSTFFNGTRLYIYLHSVNEVFYHFSEEPSRFGSYFSFLSPARLFTNMTRKTLFALFNVESAGMFKNADGSTHFKLTFKPKMKAVFKQIFAVGHYQMTFSDQNYLPFEVIEYSLNGQERGRLKVIEYKMNADLTSEQFDFVPPDNAIMVPIKVVIAQKIEEYARSLVDKLGSAAEKIKRTIYDWSF